MLVLQLMGLVSGQYSPAAGQYLVSYDPDGRGGRGSVVTTADPRKAKLFSNTAEVAALYRAVSTVLPTRVDGNPNRPLTAFVVVIAPLVGALEDVEREKRKRQPSFM